MDRLRSEDATISSFVAVIAVALIAVAGLAYDGGQIVTATTHARDLASAAARAGAQQVAVEQVHDGRAYLNEPAAHAAATAFLAVAGADGSVEVTGGQVRVTVTIIQPMRILPLPDRNVTVTAVSATISDVLEAGT